MKENIRIASVRGKGIYKRCRKEERIFVEGIGATDEEAIESLKKAARREVERLRSYGFEQKVTIYSSVREKCKDYTSITRLIFPECSKDCDCKIYEIDLVSELEQKAI